MFSLSVHIRKTHLLKCSWQETRVGARVQLKYEKIKVSYMILSLSLLTIRFELNTFTGDPRSEAVVQVEVPVVPSIAGVLRSEKNRDLYI